MSIYYVLKRQCFWKTGPLPRASHRMLSRRDPQAESLVKVLCGLPAQDPLPGPARAQTQSGPAVGGRALHTHTFTVTLSPSKLSGGRRHPLPSLAPPRPPVPTPVLDSKQHDSHHSPSHVQTHIWRFCRGGRGPVAGSPGLW